MHRIQRISMIKVTALLPMKGNSERVKDKNMKNFAGFPLYHAIVKSLLGSKYIEHIIIDTDSERIAQDAKNHFNDKVIIVDRPKEIQGDFVSMNEIIAYDLTQVEGEIFLQTHSTNPLLKVETIDSAIEKYLASIETFDSVFGVTKVQTRFYDQQANPINHNPKELLRTQDLEPYYEENSNLYIFSKTSFIQAENRRIGLRPQIFEINKLEAIDIDEPEDFTLATLLYTHNR